MLTMVPRRLRTMASNLVVILVCVLLVLLTGCCTFTRRLLAWPNESKQRMLFDETGRISIYHGVNISNYTKHCAPPYDSTGRGHAGHPWHDEKEAADLERWGFNLVRYLVHWEAMEPKRGEYDEAYIDTVISKIRTFGQHGVKVIVDVHQDLYAQRYHGNGFPDWTVRDDGKKFELQEPWAKNYLQPAVRACFDNFWSNKDGILDANIAAIEHLLVRLAEVHPTVLAIDVMNEPWPKGWPLTFERKTLSLYYQRLVVMWLKYNNGYPHLAFEPWMSTSAGYPSNLRMDNEDENFRGLLYMPHYYDFLCEQDKPYKSFNKNVMKRAFNIRSYEAQEFKCPMLYGEFGFPTGARGYMSAFKDFLYLADKHRVSWSYWSYDKTIHNDRGFLNEDGTVAQNGFLLMLVRIYPQRVGGENPHWTFDGKTFEMEWECDVGSYTSLPEPTEIFVPEVWEIEAFSTGPYCRIGNKVICEPNPMSKDQWVKIVVKNRKGFPV